VTPLRQAIEHPLHPDGNPRILRDSSRLGVGRYQISRDCLTDNRSQYHPLYDNVHHRPPGGSRGFAGRWRRPLQIPMHRCSGPGCRHGFRRTLVGSKRDRSRAAPGGKSVSDEPLWGRSRRHFALSSSGLSRFRRTLVGSKREDAVHVAGSVVQFQTNPCGVEAPRGRRSRDGTARFRRTLVGSKLLNSHHIVNVASVSDEPLWGRSSAP